MKRLNFKLAKIRFIKILTGTLAGLTLVIFLSICWHLRDEFTYIYDHAAYRHLYNVSQYSNGYEIMTDYELYAYAGYEYLISGDLAKINIEHPPLGKYLIGLSILIFGNQNAINILYGLGLLWLSWKVSTKFLVYFLKKEFAALLSTLVPLMLVFEPTFWENMTVSLLELPQTMFLLLFFDIATGYSNIYKKNFYVYIVLGLLIGIIAAIKFPAMAIILSVSLVISRLDYSDLSQTAKYKNLLYVAGVSLITFFISYIPLVLTTGIVNLVEIMEKATRIQLSHVPEYPFGMILRVLYLNQWLRWFEPWGYQSATYWNWTWPLIATVILLSPIFFVTVIKKFQEIWLIIIFIWLYFVFLASRLFFPNYLFPLMPLAFMLLVFELVVVVNLSRVLFRKGKKNVLGK